ncbi:MAG: glycosyltransferase family 2 protein [Acidimicrobiia bacterium]
MNGTNSSAATGQPSLVSVVIPNLNGESTLGDQLDALASQTYGDDWEVVVADNGSTDRSVDIAREWGERHDRLRLVDASQRRGRNAARNQGASAAQGDLILFCDNDDVVSAEWLEAMVEALADHDLVGGWIEQESLNEDTSGWRTPAPRDRLPVAIGFLPFAPSGNCGIRTDVFERLGGWNEEYEGGGEDEELSFRAGLAGYKLGFAPDAVIHYRHRSDGGSLARQQYAFGREEAHLYRDFRQDGLRRSSTRTALTEWAWLVWHLPDLFRADDRRGNWIRKAATRWGRLVGSVKYRVFYL